MRSDVFCPGVSGEECAGELHITQSWPGGLDRSLQSRQQKVRDCQSLASSSLRDILWAAASFLQITLPCQPNSCISLLLHFGCVSEHGRTRRRRQQTQSIGAGKAALKQTFRNPHSK